MEALIHPPCLRDPAAKQRESFTDSTVPPCLQERGVGSRKRVNKKHKQATTKLQVRLYYRVKGCLGRQIVLA